MQRVDITIAKSLYLLKSQDGRYWVHTKELIDLLADLMECNNTVIDDNKVVPLEDALGILYKLELSNFGITKVIAAIQQFVKK